MKVVGDIMIRDILTVNDSDSVHDARMLLKQKGIRHLPVVSHQSGEFAGLLTQRSLLNHALNIVEKFGLSGLEKREIRTPVSEIMNVECQTVSPDEDLVAAGELFLSKKASCLPVVRDGRLLGIITSVDYVKLALALLKPS